MAKPKRMTAAELASAVGGQIDDAKAYDGTDRADDREWALRFFNGEVDFNPMGKDRSSFVSRDVADIHGMIMPGLLRVFFSSDRIAIYEPTRKEHEPYANQATDLVNFVVLKECDGYRHFRDAFSDGLLLGNGVMKHWWDSTKQYTTDSFTGLTEEKYRFVLNEPDFEEEIEHEEYPDPDWVRPELPPGLPPQLVQMLEAMSPKAESDEAPPAVDLSDDAPSDEPESTPAAPIATVGPPAVPPELAPLIAQLGLTAPILHDVTIKRLRSKGRLRVSAVPNEEFLIDRATKVLDETCRFCAHRQRKTRSDLLKEGYPRSKIDAIPAFAESDDSTDRQARDDSSSAVDHAPDRSTEFVEIYECYVLIDFDGDGIAERRRVVLAGVGSERNMLVNEEWGDDLPFSDIVPDPRPHVWRGHSLYHEAGDIQRIKSVGWRGLLDNTYQQLVPQREVEIGAYANMDELYNPTHGGVLLREEGKPPATTVAIPFIGDKITPLFDIMDAVAEKRTGISARSQALDMDALANQSATAVNAAVSAAYSKIEEYARNIAKCSGLKRVFACCLKLIAKHQDREKTIRLRGKLVDIDPRGWDAEMDVTINTGLGTGSRERDFVVLQGIAAQQKEALTALGGPLNPTLNIGHIFDTMRKMAEAGGVPNPDAFFPDLSQDDVAKMREAQAAAPPPPNPSMMEAQAKLQLDQQRQEFTFQMEQRKAAFQEQQAQQQAARDAQKELLMAQRSAETERAQAQADIAVEQRKLEGQQQLERMRFEFERDIALLEFRLDAWKTMRSTAAVQGAGIPPVLPAEFGGEVDELATSIDPMLTEAATPPPTPLEQAIAALIETGRQQLDAMREQSLALSQGLGLVAESNGQMAAAIAAPKTVTTPSGATYTAKAAVN